MELDVHWSGAAPSKIGTLYQNVRGTVFFEYDSAWKNGPRELSPLYLSNSTNGAVNTPTPDFGELHGLFQDVLPDWWGERLMQRYFESLGVPWSRVTALRKLSCQGNRKMGALSFLPCSDESNFNDHMITEIGALVDAACKMLKGETGEILAALLHTGMSPGGAQPKALLAISEDLSEIRLEDPAPAGFHPWLVKFDTEPVLQHGRIEAAYADMARAAGITVPHTRLLESSSGCHFLTRRFDRRDNGERLHLHSYSGLTHTPLRNGIEYGDLIEVTRTLTNNHSDVVEVFRRAVFNVVAANDDDHGRNHAFLMDAEGRWFPSPAFDLTISSYPLASGFRAARVNGKSTQINLNDLLKLASQHHIDNARNIIDEVMDAVSQWSPHAVTNGVSPGQASWVASQHRLNL